MFTANISPHCRSLNLEKVYSSKKVSGAEQTWTGIVPSLHALNGSKLYKRSSGFMVPAVLHSYIPAFHCQDLIYLAARGRVLNSFYGNWPRKAELLESMRPATEYEPHARHVLVDSSG